MGVMVSCKNCGKEFRLRAVKIDSEQSLKTDTFSNVNEVCPNCGEMNTYNQKSMCSYHTYITWEHLSGHCHPPLPQLERQMSPPY